MSQASTTSRKATRHSIGCTPRAFPPDGLPLGPLPRPGARFNSPEQCELARSRQVHQDKCRNTRPAVNLARQSATLSLRSSGSPNTLHKEVLDPNRTSPKGGICTYINTFLHTYTYMYIYICIHIHLYVYRKYMYTCLSIYLSIHLSIYPSIFCTDAYVFVYTFDEPQDSHTRGGRAQGRGSIRCAEACERQGHKVLTPGLRQYVNTRHRTIINAKRAIILHTSEVQAVIPDSEPGLLNLVWDRVLCSARTIQGFYLVSQTRVTRPDEGTADVLGYGV